MKYNKSIIRIVTFLLIALPLVSLIVRYTANEKVDKSLQTKFRYHLKYDFSLLGEGEFKVKTYLPINNHRQQISTQKQTHVNSAGNEFFGDENKKITWTGIVDGRKKINYEFSILSKSASYTIPSDLTLSSLEVPISQEDYIEAEEYIQSEDPRIQTLADTLAGNETQLLKVLEAYYRYAFEIPKAPISQLTDAITTIENYEASCNGKSRLMVALCRSKGIPSRVAGGIILENTKKKTSHLWVEVLVNDTWIPFDPLNGYFAQIPANYLELYKGDHFLITRNADIDFDYFYTIKRERINTYSKYATIDLWKIVDNTKIPSNFIMILILLPLGAFVVALFKNVIGLKTYGIFLPALIGFSFIETGFLVGLLLFTLIVVFIGLINYPLDKWGILHTPKMVVMLTAVVVFCLIAIQFLFHTRWTDPAVALYFPIIILTITAERFARKIEEDSFGEAFKIYVQTILVTSMCFIVLSSSFIQHFFITFPEMLLAVAGLGIQLGKWIGLRIMEYSRFYKLTLSSNAA